MKTASTILILGALTVMTYALEVGQPAPAVGAPSTTGETINLSAYTGQWLVVYFYPKSFTPGCTRESCSLRDGYADLKALGAAILGVSFDKLETQKKFKAEHKLPFELLADESKEVARAFDAVGVGGLMAQRKTFIIDPDGNIAHVFAAVNVGTHDADVAAKLKELQQKPQSPSGD
jgi:peroxiredoxin Q/BCP